MTFGYDNTNILLLEGEAEKQWDEFIFRHPKGTFFHRAGWKRIIENVFGFKTYYIYAKKENAICGILPLAHTGKGLFGNRLISTPFCVQGGPLVYDEMIQQKLDAYAIDLAMELDVDWLEFRSWEHSREDWICQNDLYCIFRREISSDPDVNLKLIPRKQRAAVRKAVKQGKLKEETDPNPDRFYSVYSVSVRNLGSPVFPKKYCEELKREFGDDCEFLTITGPKGEAVSSVLSFYFKDEVLPYYGGGTPESREFFAQAYMYYRLMCRAGKRGAEIFDFGRSKQGTGAFLFKKNFGFEPSPLNYEFKLIAGQEIPKTNPLNPKYQNMIAVWQRLPLAVTKLIGPYLVKRLG